MAGVDSTRFRNSSVPEWNGNENNGYFRSRNSVGGGNPAVFAGQRPVQEREAEPRSFLWKLVWHKFEIQDLPRDTHAAARYVKAYRTWVVVKQVLGVHLLISWLYFCVFPERYGKEQESKSLFMKFVGTTLPTILGWNGMFFLFTLSLTVQMFMIQLTSNPLRSARIQDEINRWMSGRHLLKPVFLVSFVLTYYNYFLELFDKDYRTIIKTKEEKRYFLEDHVVVPVAVVVATLHFFVTSWLDGDFLVRFPAIATRFNDDRFFDYRTIKACLKPSLLISLGTWLFSLLFGSLVYSGMFYPLRAKAWEDRYLERAFVYLNFRFLLRLLFYTFLTRTLLPLLLRAVNYELVRIINLPIERTGHFKNCLTLSEALRAENRYVRQAAFYEYNLKANHGLFDASIFYKITHPGNHPRNWKNVFEPSIEAMNQFNDTIINFLKATPLPPNFLQHDIGPYILNKLRDPTASVTEQPVLVVPAVEQARGMGNMRDLTSADQGNLPNRIPTITETIQLNLELMLNDMKVAIRNFFSMQTLSVVVFGGKLEATIHENVIANVLTDCFLAYWAMSGTNKLMCNANESRVVVNPDIAVYYRNLCHMCDSLNALNVYISKTLDDKPGINRETLRRNKETLSLVHTGTKQNILRLLSSYAKCLDLLGISHDSDDVGGYYFTYPQTLLRREKK